MAVRAPAATMGRAASGPWLMTPQVESGAEAALPADYHQRSGALLRVLNGGVEGRDGLVAHGVGLAVVEAQHGDAVSDFIGGLRCHG